MARVLPVSSVTFRTIKKVYFDINVFFYTFVVSFFHFLLTLFYALKCGWGKSK